MPSQQLMMCLITQQTNIAAKQLRLGLLNKNEMELVSKRTVALGNTLLYVFDYPFLTISDIGDTLLCSPSDFAMGYILKTVFSTRTMDLLTLPA